MDEGRVDEFGNKEFIVEITGGPKKYFRRRRHRNPLFQKPKASGETPIGVHWYANLIGQLRLFRLTKGLKQIELANILKSSQAAISRFENCRTNPTLKFLISYADAVGRKLAFKIKSGR